MIGCGRYGHAIGGAARALAWGVMALAPWAPAQQTPPEPRPYAITGYWLFGRSKAGQWAQPLDRIHSLGGDTIVQFGPRLTPVDPDEGSWRKRFEAFMIDGLPVVEATRRELEALDPGNRLRRVFALTTHEAFGADLLVRPSLDRRVDAGECVFWRLVIPSDSPASRDPVFQTGVAYDLVLISPEMTITAVMPDGEATVIEVTPDNLRCRMETE